MEGMQLQKQRLEAESKKEEQSKKQHQDVANAAVAVSNYHKTSRKTKLSHGLILYRVQFLIF